ncbi:MAG: SPOR domain-containing protein [Methylobacter sp.]|uniref:SPOR domain-containing protein n=1 Tax=Candidatus Methylobacter titanis TaxID=3053457 RepID=A0AA43Q9Q6_9GAMM|nr:SPOR domain-containing protein [Candidatus Methylobacter titanis]
MDHELKQRLIGAVVVTALCAIFIPMLFDDPVDNSGKLVSELSIPTPGSDGRTVPSSADQVLGLPDPEPLSIENASDTLESAGVEEEPEKQDRSGESLYAESEGYTEDANTKDLVEQPLSAEATDDDGESTQLGDSQIKTVVKVPEKVQKVIETIKPVTVKKPVQAPATVKQSTPKPSSVTKDLAAVVVEAKKPVAAAKASSKLVRWYIQLGSFSKKENAVSYWKSLNEQGLPASLDTVQTDKGITYRLRLGPELDQKKAAAMKARLDKKNIKAVLMSE